MAVNTCEIWSNGIKIAFFFQNITKNRPTAGGLAPRPPKPPAAGDPRPQTPVCDTFELHKLLNTFPTLDICIFQLLV